MNKQNKILIVDDSADLLVALKMFLQNESYKVSTIMSFEFLTTEIKRFLPDVLILDVYLNSKGVGRDVCRKIKSDIETMNIPVILMSANYKALEDYNECRADAIIEKPFNLATLIQQIQSVLSEQQPLSHHNSSSAVRTS